ncbi:ABC transporter ATP-binding protein [Pedobacter sp. PWIIR3]
MTIKLEEIGRRFNQDWIFRGISYAFHAHGKYAILGPNGSGKSTLLSVLMGNLAPSEGTISYSDNGPVPIEQIYRSISVAAPYLDLIEEFTLSETIDFHFKFKDIHPSVERKDILSLLGLARSEDKALKYFSSGMKQRTKLLLACCSATPILILDEPTSNLDIQGVSWYHELIKEFTTNRLVIIGSNQEVEYSFCDHLLQITDYK